MTIEVFGRTSHPFAITDKEVMMGKKWADNINRRNDVQRFDFLAPSVAYPISDSDNSSGGGHFNINNFHIRYDFSEAIRRNVFRSKSKGMGQYGAANMSFRRLYGLLCEAYNGGVPFIDTYFSRVFKTRRVYEQFLNNNKVIQDAIDIEQQTIYQSLPKKADGTPDRRFSAYKKFSDFKVWQDPIIKQGCERMAADIRHDIVVCLSNGRLPLRGTRGATVLPRTQKQRAKLRGIVHPNRLFYASGQLIHALNIYVEIGDKAA